MTYLYAYTTTGILTITDIVRCGFDRRSATPGRRGTRRKEGQIMDQSFEGSTLCALIFEPFKTHYTIILQHPLIDYFFLAELVFDFLFLLSDDKCCD